MDWLHVANSSDAFIMTSTESLMNATQTSTPLFIDDASSTVSDLPPTTTTSTVATSVSGGSALSAGLLTVPAAVLAGSAMTCAAIVVDRRLHHMSYYFFMSLAVQHALMSITVMLPGVHVLQIGSFSFSDESCKLWITGDLFFCNSACLHLAFVNMDAFLRLKDPRHRRGRRVVTACSLLLWIGAPWSLSFVQSVAQFMLSQADKDSRSETGLCFISDKNFVLLGALFAYFIPSSVAIVFAVLCRAEVRQLETHLYRGGRAYDCSCRTSTDRITASMASLASSRPAVDEPGRYREMDADDTDTDDGDTSSGRRSRMTTATSVDIYDVQLDTSTVKLEMNSRQCYEVCGDGECASSSDHVTSFCTVEDHWNTQSDDVIDLLALTDQSTDPPRSSDTPAESGCKSSMRDQSTDSASDEDVDDDDDVRRADSSLPDEALRHELDLFRTTRAMLIATAILWLPLMLANIVYAVSETSRVALTVGEVMAVKWMAYSSPVVDYFVCALFSEALRQAAWMCVRRCRAYCLATGEQRRNCNIGKGIDN